MQTILLNHGSFNLCNDNLRYYNHVGSRYGHPHILTTKDYSNLTKDQVFFARKFDIEQDSKILDLLDHKVLETKETLTA